MTTKKYDIAPSAPVERPVMRPGNGWKHIGGAVWEHTSKIRIHLLGMIRLPSGEFVSAATYPNWEAVHRMIRINGGNRKRGLMVWALSYADS
jgi:hypothetical protein